MTHIHRFAFVTLVAVACAALEAPPLSDADRAAIADTVGGG